VQVLNAAAEYAKQSGDSIRAASQDAAEAVTHGAQEVAESVADATQQVADSAGATAQQAAAAVGDAIDHLPLPGGQPPAPKRSGGGFFRFVLLGLLLGAVIAYISRRGGNDDDDFGEENWIEVKHDETGPAAPAQNTPSAQATETAEAPKKNGDAPADADA
jgi:hypothetical protein